jgi:N-acetylglucosaminyl-diphospho-decaprenol L-rhamnosyltransferase
MSSSLDIIVVNWNAGRLLWHCLESISLSERSEVALKRVVVVDNASSDDSLRGLESGDLPLVLLSNTENRGFARACNQGASGSRADYLLFLNPDTRLHSQTLSRSVCFMELPENGSVGICGVRHIDESGKTATSCARFPSLKIFLWKMTGLAQLFPKVFPTHLLAEDECRESKDVDQVIGAYFLVRRSLFEALSGFDERFFVYFEEVDFSRRAKKQGYSSYYLADVTVYHRGGGSSEQAKTKRLFYSLRSRLLYAFKHFSLLEALSLSLLTVTLELASRLFVAALSLSFTRLNETIGGYAELIWYLMGKGVKWRS